MSAHSRQRLFDTEDALLRNHIPGHSCRISFFRVRKL